VTASLPLRPLLLPGLATLVALAILLGLGAWQLERKAWKEAIIAQVEARAHGEPGAVAPEASWPAWDPGADEFRRVRLTGTFLHEAETPVHGLAEGTRGAPIQGFFLLTPLRLPDGALVVVNRGFVPTDLRDPARRPGSRPEGVVAVTGLVRAPESPTPFTPDDDPARGSFFRRDPAAVAAARGLQRVAPFYVAAEAAPNGGEWPRAEPFRLNLPNNHLQYAWTWFGIAGALVGVFAVFAWRRLREPGGRSDARADGSSHRASGVLR
jgi:surfeit locus 1 family protein